MTRAALDLQEYKVQQTGVQKKSTVVYSKNLHSFLGTFIFELNFKNMVLLFYKGKGYLVFVFLFICFIGVMIMTKMFDEYVLGNTLPGQAYLVSMALSFFAAGFWIHRTGKGLYVGEMTGHSFMFIEMKMWAYLLWAWGAFTLVGGIINLIIG